jgi:DNA-binding transcriptional LysR family regulator
MCEGTNVDYFAVLTAFVEAARLNNFSRAADRLGMKASTVSRYVKDLEADLGITLFNRSTRALKLTEGGQTFLHHALKVLQALEEARFAAASLNHQPRGVLQLNAPPAFARHHIVPALEDFRAQCPEVRVQISCQERQVNLIDAGVDLAVRIGSLADSTHKARKIADVQWVLCAAPGYWQQGDTVQHPDQLQGLRFIAGKADSLALLWTRQQASISVHYSPEVVVNDIEARLIAARIGAGVALLPTWLAGPSLRDGALVPVLAHWHCAPATVPAALWFIYPPKRIVSSKVRSFIDFMVARIGTPPYWTD